MGFDESTTTLKSLNMVDGCAKTRLVDLFPSLGFHFEINFIQNTDETAQQLMIDAVTKLRRMFAIGRKEIEDQRERVEK